MKEALRKIKVIVMDVDGVLTDGRIVVDSNGVETKFFDVQDGFGVVFAQKCGLKTAIISARQSGVVKHRADDLKIDKYYVGIYPKISAYEEMIKEFNVTPEEVCFIGDDLADLVVMKRSGVAIAVANAVSEIKHVATYVTKKKGGRGAVREAIELILKAQGKWSPELYEH
jgi:3-deoxy-D-manno-octulosonate 8-phosphate phosphatase (KDO 8-P phosphatase)